MKNRTVQWGLLSIGSLLSAFACSGRNLNTLGDLNTVGGSDSALGGGQSIGGADVAIAGADVAIAGEGGRGSTASAGTSSQEPVGGNGGAAGAAGEPDDGGANGVAAPLPRDGSLVCPTCQTVALAKDIRGAASNDQKVFWIEYGSNDHFGNYNDNGRLLARDLTGDSTTVLADSLAGPEALALSGRYVYLAVDQGVGSDHFQVLRVPLSGGTAEVVHTPPTAVCWSTWEVFAFGGGSEFWTWGGAVYRLDDTSSAPPETFVASGESAVLTISASATTLYYSAVVGMEPPVWAKPLAGGEAVQLNAVSFGSQVQDGYLYGQDGNFLTRMPIAGGAWKRVGRGFGDHLAFDGDAYFTDLPNYAASNAGVRRIMQESLSNFSKNVALASELVGDGDALGPSWKAFTKSRVGVFFAETRGLYLVPPAAR